MNTRPTFTNATRPKNVCNSYIIKRRTMKFLTTLSIFVSFFAAVTAQSVPSLINCQGRLTDQGGAPLPSGNYGVQFRLWDSPTSTASNGLIWAQQQNVSVQANGV